MNWIQQYQLTLEVEPNESKLNGDVNITIDVSHSKSSLFFLLYRDLKVTEVKTNHGQLLTFVEKKQWIKEHYEVNEIEVFLPLNPIEGLQIRYEGQLNGYELAFPYVKDQIHPEFSIIRNDCLAYPILAKANEEALREGILNEFTYEVFISVPLDYVVASGGILVEIQTDEQRNKYHYRNHGLTWRIDLAIAHYQLIEQDGYRLFVFEEDRLKASETIIPKLNQVIELFETRFEIIENQIPFTLIEIKEQFGSQVGEGYILMEEHGFKGTETEITHLYHEVGHRWNPIATETAKRTRFFDEAFASYFEAIAIKYLHGNQGYEEKMEQYRQYFSQMVQYDPINLEPIADYGRLDIAYNSYTKGAFVLAILDGIMGDVRFNLFIQTLIQESKQNPIDFKDFQRIGENILKKDLERFMSDWIYEKKSSEWLISQQSMNDLIAKYLT